MLLPMNFEPIILRLHDELPTLLAVYAFGSRVQGVADSASDLDLAVLVAGYAPPLKLFALSGELSELAGCPVDLLDLRVASTVMQHQVIVTGQRLWVKDGHADVYESFILSEKTDLDAARAALMADIKRTGQVYGR